MATFTSATPEIPPQDSVLGLDTSGFVAPGRADEALWWDFMYQQAVDESASALANNQLISTTHSRSASHGVTNDTSLNDPYIDAADLGDMDFGNVDVGDIMNINDTSYDDIMIDHEERLFDYQVPESNQISWLDQITPNTKTSTSLVLAPVDTSGTSGPASLPLSADNSFASVASHSLGPVDQYANQDPWLDSSAPTNERILKSWCENTFGISPTQQQSSTVLGALMVSPNLPGTTQPQQSSVPFTTQNCDIDASSGLRYGAGADCPHSDSGYMSLTPSPLNLPIRAFSLEHESNSSGYASSYSDANVPHVDFSIGAGGPCPGLQILNPKSNQVTNNNYTTTRYAFNYSHLVPLDTSSNGLVQYTNGAAHAAPASDVPGLSQGTDLAYSNATTRRPCLTLTALPQVRRMKRKTAHPAYDPKPPSTNKLKKATFPEASGFHSGLSCLTMVLQGSNMKRPTARQGKPRTKNEQNARDRGVCPPCRKMKLSVSLLLPDACLAHHKLTLRLQCVPNDPNDPYGPCQRCVTKYDGAMMHLRGYYLTACRRSFSDFSELLRPQLECREIHRPLYLSCIRIGAMLDFLDLALTGPPSSQLTLTTSLRVCMILATLHKFCSQTSDKIYSQFSKMALWYWSKACENLAGAYDNGMTAEATFELLVQVAADFANHLNQRAVNQGLPRGLLNTTVLNAELARQAWFGYETRELWYLSIDSRVPLRLPPGLVKTIASGLKRLPGWLHEQNV